MPGVVMENGDKRGAHTNHERDRMPNGASRGVPNLEKPQDGAKGRVEPSQNMTPTSPGRPNGFNRVSSADALPTQVKSEAGAPATGSSRLQELPEEVVHITQGYLPLSMLLQRLAQKTHVDLSRKVMELAAMPLPASAAAVNGNTSHYANMDDTSAENLAKKKRLLEFAQSTHADWIKALVITNWSRRSEDVSKAIDLKIHIDEQKVKYDQAIWEMIVMKRNLALARLPNPDLKTGLQVLSTGKASWMPELNYIDPPRLTPRNLIDSLENLNTLLSIRLNLHEYDKIPWQMQNYSINSGRVTFTITEEFELDLTIADEEPESQFWFIDFRFAFSPAPTEMPPSLRSHLENRVNTALLQDGLPGCYKLLHEMTLTQKISEYRRQTINLSRGRWIESLKSELLNRSLSIQYWLDRYGKQGPKSWIILGVHSGRRKDGRPDPKATSRLFVRWFRDGKEIKDVEISCDGPQISAESLLKGIIARHINHILKSMYKKLQSRPLFASGEASLSLFESVDDPSESHLKVQLTTSEQLTVNIEHIDGRFKFSPPQMTAANLEHQLNSKSQDPAENAHSYIETLRCQLIAQEISNHALSVGWVRMNNPGIKEEAVRVVIGQTTSLAVWLRRPGWKKNWILVISVSMSGEQWWLLETTPTSATNNPPELRITSSFKVPVRSASPLHTFSFLSTLTIFVAALLSHFTDLRALHSRRQNYLLRSEKQFSSVTVPSIFLKFTKALIQGGNILPRTNKPWARNVIQLTFQGLETSKRTLQSSLPADTPGQTPKTPTIPMEEEVTNMITEARMTVTNPKTLKILKERVDEDIAFNPKSGAFAFRLRVTVGESVIPALVERITRVRRLVDFVEVLQKYEATLRCETISLGKIVFAYQFPNSTGILSSYTAAIDFGTPDDIMTLEFDQGNPHLRIEDYLTRILNSASGLEGVTKYLPFTLPALRAIDTIETAWTTLDTRGDVLVFVRSVEWYILRYSLSPVDGSGSQKKVVLDIKMQRRRNEPWWYIRRTDTRSKDGKNDKDEKDEIDAALKPVWDGKGEGWMGMRVSAVAKATGVEELIGKLDEVLRTVDLGGKDASSISQGAMAPQLAAPVAQMQSNPRQSPTATRPPQGRQQAPANANHSQDQAREKPRVKREVVEID